MKETKWKNKKEMLRKIRIIAPLIFLGVLFLAGCATDKIRTISDKSDKVEIQQGEIQNGIYKPRFLPDNDSIMFMYDYHEQGLIQTFKLGIYEISSGRAHRYEKLPKEFGSIYPYFSRDGKQIVFTGWDGNKREIYIMNSDGTNLKKLTSSPEPIIKTNAEMKVKHYNTLPSFSKDGRKIIFARGPFDNGKKILRYGYWDYYEIDLATGKEIRLTNNEFGEISQPFYLPDGESIVFAAKPKGAGYQANTLFMIDKKSNRIKQMLEDTWSDENPKVSSDGKILFKSFLGRETAAEVDKLSKEGKSGWDLALFEGKDMNALTGQNIKPLVAEYKGNYIADFDISPDGKRIVYIIGDILGNQTNSALWFVNSNGKELRKISLN